jgi:hypothetical protein
MIALLAAVLCSHAADRKSKAAPPPPEPAPAEEQTGSLQRSSRMEFDERLIRGQGAASGAVYLFDRAPRELPGLVPLRRSYRDEIVEPILGDRELKPALYSTDDVGAELDWAPFARTTGEEAAAATAAPKK